MLAFLVSAIRLGMTFLLGSTGETIAEKSGHLNLGIPGVMCVGASCGCFAEYLYFSAVKTNIVPVLAVIIPIVAAFIGAAFMGLMFSFLTVTLRANQNVTGLAITTLGVGISNYMIDETSTIFTKGSKYFTASLPFADDLGWFGELFLSYGIFVYLAIAIALTTSFVLSKTKVGLHLRSVGENPATADAAGINVVKYKYLATCTGGIISGLGGLCYVMDFATANWQNNILDQFGWLSVALVIFALWKPIMAILGSIIFGVLYVVGSFLPNLTTKDQKLLDILPYLVTIIVLVIISMRKKKEHQPPQSLGLPYFREER